MSDNISGGGNWDFWTTTSYGVALDKMSHTLSF